ncbi:MerC domain-containing protein [Mucilaginibacter sp. OK098]|uniref:MerC domain-containing protein n=1 Tax=Mucilaginibacter sp. OK098 TaxID=1855297 RepID=UPI00093442FE|nr:MerC domain-containing protein [Mucilaginibacter sp. OK098]
MNHPKHSSKLDNVGMTASILCAVHCAIVPLLITSLPLLGLGFLANPWVEWSMITFAVFIGFYAIGLSYVRSHHRILPLVLLFGGFLVIIIGHIYVTSWREAIIVPFGGLLIATAHFFNYKYTSICSADNTLFHLKHSHPHKH